MTRPLTTSRRLGFALLAASLTGALTVGPVLAATKTTSPSIAAARKIPK